MDYTNFRDSSKYVMSVDMLDLALLPNIYPRLNKNTSLLWTASNSDLKTNDYFQFEVKPKTDAMLHDDTTTDNDMDIYERCNQSQSNPSVQREDIAMTVCYICDLELPIAYLIDHEHTLKHKAHIKIAEAVLDRTRKHMKTKPNGTIKKDDTMYFCGPCATEIEVVNKTIHEKSKAHKQAVSLDRLLYELVSLYTNEDHDFEEANLLTNDKTLRNVLRSEVDKNIDNSTVLISDITSRLDEFEMKTIENYIKLIDECEADKSYVLSSAGDDLRVSMQNNRDVIVPMDHFNGFIRMNENFILCIVCKVIIGNENAHKISNTHIKNIVTPFKDHHCIRNLYNSTSHCVICNKIVGDSDLHVLTDETHIELSKKALVLSVNKSNDEILQKSHVKKLKPNELLERALIVDENKTVKRNETDNTVYNGFDESDDDIFNMINPNRRLSIFTEIKPKTNEDVTSLNNIRDSSADITISEIDKDTYFCRACNLKMHVNNIKLHIKGAKHLMNSKSNVHYMMKKDTESSDLLCRVCNVYVTDDVSRIKEHISTNDHTCNYRDLLQNNCVIREKKQFHCKPCDMVLMEMNELYHIEKMNHEINLANFIVTEKKDNNQNTSVNVSVNDPKLSEKTHVYYCNICNVYVPNNPHNINGHNDGDRHKKNISAAKVEVADSIKTNSTVTENSDVRYQMDATENEKNLMCKVCQVVVPNMDVGITEHVNGKKHQSSLKSILDANHIDFAGDQYFCKNCNVPMKIHNLFIHMNQTRHKTLLGNLEENPEVIKTIETPVSQDNSNHENECNDTNTINSNNKNTEAVDNLYLKFKHHFIETEDKEWLQCKICGDIDIPNTAEDVANHTAKQTHANGYINLMSDNLIFETEQQNYFCGICICLVPLKGEVHHAKGLRHARNYVSVTSEEKCSLCNVTASDVSMFDHITSHEHVIKVMTSQTLLHYCLFCKLLMQKDKAEKHPKECHKFAVKDKICFCTICDPYLPTASRVQRKK